ncbi:MAG: sigma-70 family RNA polymerase sigma factor [Gammaproteobacteria bacterium]|nr:sigma-70 family RNA polymerase sigma factor [Gammaproteobacteria bacterium]
MTDDELLKQFLDGNESAFKELVSRHQHNLYRFVWRQVGNHDDTSDICQASFVQVYRKAAQFQGHAAFKSWLYKIAINLSKNHHRSAARQRIDKNVEPEIIEKTGSDTGCENVLDDEQKARIKSVISRLPEKQRLTIQLRFFQECTLKQVAEIMECPIGTAKANYHHALKTLRQFMQGDDYE